MTILVPIMLFGWIPFTIFLFLSCKPHHAALVSVIGGWLLLPQTGYNLPGLPEYNKSMAIALGLILGGRISGHKQASSFQWRIYDLPMIMWCLCPIATSLTNQLGLYDGISSFFREVVRWGVPYLAGRIYFNSTGALRDLCLGIIIGGLLYVPLCLFEIRMSPQLSNIFYGFFPHSFVQHFRYGGYRPIVFMQHGLAVSLWMAVSSMLALWVWQSSDIKNLKGVHMSLIFAILAVTCVLCKSANGWIVLFLGCGSYFIYSNFKSRTPFLLLLLSVPIYICIRLSGFVTAHNVETLFSKFLDANRVASLAVRLLQEDLFSEKAIERPVFGWGGYGRSWPVDPYTGEKMVEMIDAFWIGCFSTRGFVGLISFVCSMLLGPWLALRYGLDKKNDYDFSAQSVVVLSLVVVFFMIDSLVNGMFNPLYVLITGVLVSQHIHQKKQAVEEKN